MWTANITSKELVNGLLKVNVLYSNGTESFTDKYETRSGQDENWLKTNIDKRLADLDSVYAFEPTITLGVYDPAVVPPPAPLEGRALYEHRLKLFDAMVSAIRKGLITDTNTQFVNLKQWLKNNFDESYIDLF